MATLNRHIETHRRLRDAGPYYEDSNYQTTNGVWTVQATIVNIIWTIAGSIMVLLGIRFVFALLGANSANSFVHFIYTESHPFVTPFFNMFNYNVVTISGVARFEIYTLVAIAAYALIAWALTSLVTINRR